MPLTISHHLEILTLAERLREALDTSRRLLEREYDLALRSRDFEGALTNLLLMAQPDALLGPDAASLRALLLVERNTYSPRRLREAERAKAGQRRRRARHQTPDKAPTEDLASHRLDAERYGMSPVDYPLQGQDDSDDEDEVKS